MTAPLKAQIVSKLIEMNAEIIDQKVPVRKRVTMLWRMGDELRRAKVDHPHGVGSRLQAQTNKAVTRAVIFRAAKVRQLFHSEESLLNEVGGIKSIQYLYDMFALLDPGKSGSELLSLEEKKQLFEAARLMNATDFKAFLKSRKRNVKGKMLGYDRRTSSALGKMAEFAKIVINLKNELQTIVEEQSNLDKFRGEICADECEALANMAIAMASPANLRFFRRENPVASRSANVVFALVYNEFRRLLSSSDDRERSRLRKYLGGGDFEAIASILAAINDDASIKAYRISQKLTFQLPLTSNGKR